MAPFVPSCPFSIAPHGAFDRVKTCRPLTADAPDIPGGVPPRHEIRIESVVGRATVSLKGDDTAMIAQSHHWKKLILRQEEMLNRVAKPHRWNEASSLKLEQAAVLGFYAVRRLINFFLLADALVHRPVPLTVFPARHKSGPLLGDEPLEDLYDLNDGKAASHDLLFICHQVTYNCIFMPFFGQDGALKGIYVTSDHQRKAALYGISIESVKDLLHRCGSQD